MGSFESGIELKNVFLRFASVAGFCSMSAMEGRDYGKFSGESGSLYLFTISLPLSLVSPDFSTNESAIRPVWRNE